MSDFHGSLVTKIQEKLAEKIANDLFNKYKDELDQLDHLNYPSINTPIFPQNYDIHPCSNCVNRDKGACCCSLPALWGQRNII